MSSEQAKRELAGKDKKRSNECIGSRTRSKEARKPLVEDRGGLEISI
jgi:hypothetical protein